MRLCARLPCLVVGIVAAIISNSPIASAKAKFFTLAEKTRGAEIVLMGRVSALADDHVTVDVKKTIKGSVPEGQITVEWDRNEDLEKPVARHRTGDDILLFANRAGARYVPFAAGQGTLKLGKGWSEQYEAAINAIQSYDAARDDEERINLLNSMLAANNRLVHDVALLEILRLKPAMRRSESTRIKLLPHIVRLAKGPDRDVAIRATQTLDSIGGKDAATTLVDLVGSEHGEVAEVASRALSQKTGIKKEVRSRQSASDRQKARREWEAWWNQNKEKVKLRE